MSADNIPPFDDGPPNFSRLGPLSRIVLGLATVASLFAMALMIYEGISRFIVGISYDWIEEIVRYLLIWAFFLTLGIAGFRQCHIRTELLVQRLPAHVQRLTWILACGLGIGFAAVLGYSSIAHLQRFYASRMVSESTLELPMWIVFLAMPVGAVALFLYYAIALHHAMFRGDPFGAEQELTSPLAETAVDTNAKVPLL